MCVYLHAKFEVSSINNCNKCYTVSGGGGNFTTNPPPTTTTTTTSKQTPKKPTQIRVN